MSTEPKNYTEYHDERLIDILKKCKEEKACKIFERLYQRKLFKMIGELQLKDVDDARAKKRLLQMNDDQKLQWEIKIAGHLQIDSDYVIVNKPQIRNPNYGSRSYNLNQEAIMIFDEEEKKLKTLINYATELILARPISDESALGTVQVYAPRDNWNNLPPTERQQKQTELEAKVQQVLRSP